MKRRLLNGSLLKRTALAVPAAALMLGAAQAGTTVGLNFQSFYYDSGTTPQTIGFGFGYQTTGFPVTAKAFGVDPANWFNTAPLPTTAAGFNWNNLPVGGVLPVSTSISFRSLTLDVTAQNLWETDLGNLADPAHEWEGPATVLPGNDQVTWSYLDNTGWTNTLSGLNAAFPNGYVIELIGASGSATTNARVIVTAGEITTTNAFDTIYTAGNANYPGPVGLLAIPGTSDTITFGSVSRPAPCSALAGFIVTDQPVVSRAPGGTYNAGTTISLSARVVGLSPISYQWQHAGTNVPGATSATFTKAGASPADAGDYQLVATNPYGAGTSAVANVTVVMVPTITQDLPSAVTNYLTMNENFVVTVGGQAPLYYQWKHAGTNLPGATASMLSLSNLKATDAGTYQVVVTNSLGSAASAVSTLTVLGTPPSEGFAYADGDITGQNGGTGWAGAWTSPGNGQNYAASPGATYRDAASQLVVSGGALQMSAAGSADFISERDLSATLGGGGTIYLSFMGQFTNSGWAGIWLKQGAADQLFIGQGWYDSPWGFGGFPYPQFMSSRDSHALSFVVCRLDYTATNTSVQMYVNPALNAEPATADASGTIASVIQFNRLRVATHNYSSAMPNGLFDEFRIGGSWASVTPNVPRTDPPILVRDLAGVSTYAYAGGNATMSIVADGAPTLHYQWKRGTTPVGSDSPTLTLASVTTANNGDYSVTVTNPYGNTNSVTNHLTVLAAPDVYTSQVMPDAPGAFWPLNETAGPVANDYSGGGKDGTLNGSLPSSVAGPRPPAYQGFGSSTPAYQFDGASYIDCGTAPSVSGTSDFTVEAWINTTNTANSDIFSQRDASGYNGEFELQVRGNGQVYFYIYGNGNYQFSITSPANGLRVNDGKWHHVAAARSGTNGVIYIDGSAVATASGTYVATLNPAFKFSIGATLRTSPNTFFLGQMCNLALYNYAVPAARIGAHAYTGWLNTSPVRLSIASGGWVEDSKPTGLPYVGQNLGVSWVASVTDANTVTRTGVAQFSSGAQVSIPASADLNSPSGTICFWMRMGLPPAGHGMMLFDRRTSAGLVLVVDGTPSGGFGVQYTGNASFSTAGYVVDDNWHQVTLTYDQSASGTVAVYVDGVNVGSQANTNTWSWPTTQQVELARSHDTYWQEYNGQLDDFRIYNRILTATEIATIAAPATSDTLVDTAALKLRYNFGTAAGVGTQLSWPIGTLQGAPALGSPTTWTPIGSTAASYPFLPPSGVTNSAMFYKVKVY
jgi:hypothetical protein